MSSSVEQPPPHFVLVQSNEPDENRLLTFRRDEAGALSAAGSVGTAGSGNGMQHLPSQGSVILSGNATHAFVTNTGSGSLSVFTISKGGPVLTSTVPAGATPLSVTEHDGLVYVLNSDDASLSGFVMEAQGLSPVDGSARRWNPDGKPAQVGFSADGRTLVVTERGANRIVTFAVESSGSLGEPMTRPSSGVTPYGFGVTPTGVLVVTEAFGGEPGKSAASTYVLKDVLTPVSESVGNGRTALCWAVVTPDGRYAFGTNYADGAVSRYDIAPDGTLALGDATAGLVANGSPGPRDLDLSADGQFLYAIDADSQQIVGWSVNPAGRLTKLGSWPGLPSTIAGIAAS